MALITVPVSDDEPLMRAWLDLALPDKCQSLWAHHVAEQLYATGGGFEAMAALDVTIDKPTQQAMFVHLCKAALAAKLAVKDPMPS